MLRLVLEGPAETLNQTDKTQPALLTASVALWRLYQAHPDFKMPSVMAGYSLGEYAALVCAGAMAFQDAVQLVALRGQLMQQAVPAGEGAMYAILGLTAEEVTLICQQHAHLGVVSAVNFNSPEQTVIAGEKDAVAAAAAACKEVGAKRALPLPVSVPSHCALMQPAAQQLMAITNH